MQLPPLLRRAPWLTTLAIGATGSLLLDAASMPLAWMLGALLFTATAGAVGLPVGLPPFARRIALTFVGVHLGSSFTADTTTQLLNSLPSLLLMTIAVIIVVILSHRILISRTGVDPTIALCASIPGGISLMAALGEERGDKGVIALAQSLRIVMVVTLLSLIARGWLESATPAPPSGNASTATAWTFSLGLAGLCALIGVLARWRMTAFLATSMTLSALCYGFEWMTEPPPVVPLNLSLLILGASFGATLGGFRGAHFLRLSKTLFWINGVALALTALFAGATAAILNLPYAPVFLAFAPGGLSEVMLIAIAFDVQPAFVAAHHIFRLLAIMLLTRKIIQLIERKNPTPAESDTHR